MATTSELCDLLEDQFKGWYRDGPRGVLRYLNTAQNFLCRVAAHQLLLYDDTTGKLPVLNTTAGVFSYNLPSTVNFIGGILVEADTNADVLNLLLSNDYGSIEPNSYKPDYISISGIRHVRIPFVRSYPAGETSAARVLFTRDPGTSIDTYRRMSYKKPEQLVSDTIDLTIPPPWDELYLLPAAVKLIEGVNHGNYIEARAAIVRDFLPLMWEAFNEGEQGIDTEPPDRGF